jgi:2-polyprenyl-3-methyl-5-hydroxy-6-metoxy-1,4-benzoquinol methylase
MKYRQLTQASPSRIKRFSHRRRLHIAEGFASNGPILDYGAGDAELLRLLASQPGCTAELWGFEPYLIGEARDNLARLVGDRVRLVESFEGLPTQHFDRVYCLEVLEHLPEPLQIQAVRNIGQLMAPGGRCVISVPIEVGPASLAKNVVRLIVRQSHPGTTPMAIMRSVFGRPIVRPDGDYISSHIGFRHQQLEGLLASLNVTVERRTCSPFPWLGSWANSQVFYLCRLPPAGEEN